MSENKGKRKNVGNASLNGGDKKSRVSEPTYGWRELHADVMAGKVCGVYGGAHAAYHGLAELRSGVHLKEFHKKRSPDEFILPALQRHINDPKVQENWSKIFTIDPLGLVAQPPTMAATTAVMTIPELRLHPDGKIVNEDGSINTIKVAMDYVWNIPEFAKRIQVDEKKMRKALAEYTHNERILDEKYKAYYPPVGGCCVYVFGDMDKLQDSRTEIAVRVHDACCGSDVFGTDICTCRPYLVFAIQGAVECAQRGGVGIVAYFQKEGRSLGEITKYRVYNARKGQAGGDRAETYFSKTESIAGIRDARFQEMMPDVLMWLGVKRIHWLLSMSSEKFDAIKEVGIEVLQRVALPDMYVPKAAHVEITAKISAGYHADKVEHDEVVNYLRSLEAIRDRCGQVMKLARDGETRHWAFHPEKLDETADYVIKVTKSNYPDLKIPYHSRWRHFDDADIKEMVDGWSCTPKEKARRLIDLVTVSVLLDAGAGSAWKYREGKHELCRSEGLAHATFNMFKDGIFSSDKEELPHRVNAVGLAQMTLKQFRDGFQVKKDNPIAGLEGRFELMKRLGRSLSDHREYFGMECPRPGNIVDYVLRNMTADKHISIKVLWKCMSMGLETIWPENMSGVRRGDVWVYTPLKKIGVAGSDMVPFHKLTQWLTYSLLEPLEELGIVFDDLNLMTGLAEYRNAGLFIDKGVLVPKNGETMEAELDVGSEPIVEMRALTVCLLDEVAKIMRKKLNQPSLTLAHVLQGGTWAAGRALAAEKRPGAPPPVRIRSSGTVF